VVDGGGDDHLVVGDGLPMVVVVVVGCSVQRDLQSAPLSGHSGALPNRLWTLRSAPEFGLWTLRSAPE